MQPRPGTDTARIESLDVLRGFALLGILAMNIRAMAAPNSARGRTSSRRWAFPRGAPG